MSKSLYWNPSVSAADDELSISSESSKTISSSSALNLQKQSSPSFPLSHHHTQNYDCKIGARKRNCILHLVTPAELGFGKEFRNSEIRRFSTFSQPVQKGCSGIVCWYKG
jgi:hypothetical protein